MAAQNTDNFTIRPVRPDDLDAVVTIEQAANPSPWSKRQFESELGNPVARLDLALVAGEPAAYICCWTVADEMEIQNIATAPACRRRGLAGHLLRHVLDRARNARIGKAYLEVRSGNTAARRLYQKFGFRDSGVRPRYYPDGEDAILMDRMIEGSGSGST